MPYRNDCYFRLTKNTILNYLCDLLIKHKMKFKICSVIYYWRYKTHDYTRT